MVKGRVNKRGEPLIKVRMSGGEKPLSVIVDTGFNGELCLPRKTIKELKLKLYANEYFELANGRLEATDVFKGNMAWFEATRRPVEVIATDSRQRLLGTQLLSDCKVEIDFRKRTLLIRKILAGGDGVGKDRSQESEDRMQKIECRLKI